MRVLTCVLLGVVAVIGASGASGDDAKPPAPPPVAPKAPEPPVPQPPVPQPPVPQPPSAPKAPEGPVVPAIPDPKQAGEAKPFEADFESSKGGQLPSGFLALFGRWQTLEDPLTKIANVVLRQDEKVAEYAVVLATGDGRAFADATSSVRFRPESGDEDASGGIVFRATDEKNYGLVRANANEGNFRLYVIHNGFRRQVASVDIEPPRLKAWHTIELSFVGAHFRATLDGKDAIEADNDTLAAGWCGLWTKSDSVTSFDDWKVAPAVTKPPTR